MERDALRTWLLDRLEAPALWPTGEPRLLTTNQITDLFPRDRDFLSVAALYRGREDDNLEALVAELVATESVPFSPPSATPKPACASGRNGKKPGTSNGTKTRSMRGGGAARHISEPKPRGVRRSNGKPSIHAAPAKNPRPTRSACRRQRHWPWNSEIDRWSPRSRAAASARRLAIFRFRPNTSPRISKPDYWRLRGGLDVPKERFVSFPHCQRDADGSLVVTWAGYNHLARALAIAAYYQERKDSDGWPAERLVPLLAGVIELVPWLLQWHNESDPDLGARMGDYFVDLCKPRPGRSA